MAIQSTDFQFRLSGGASNSDINASLGGAMSSNAAPAQVFDNKPSSEVQAGRVEYRCVYVRNNHGTLTATAARLFVQAQTPLAHTIIAVGVGAAAVNAPEPAIANETTAPAGVTFGTPSDYASGVPLGDIPPGQYRAFWLRLTITAGVYPAAVDTYNLRTTADSLP